MNNQKTISKIAWERIIGRFNDAIGELSESYRYAESLDVDSQQERLHSSASAVFEALEWSLRNFRADIIEDIESRLEKSPNNLGYQKDLAVLSDAHSSVFQDKVFKLIVRYKQLAQTGVDLPLLQTFKNPVRNAPVHEGVIPYHASLRAVLIETRQLLRHTFGDERTLEPLPTPTISETPQTTPDWEMFLTLCDYFDPRRRYILVSDRCPAISDELLQSLMFLPWVLVVDLDPSSADSGLLSKTRQAIEESGKKVHLFTASDQHQTFAPHYSVYWFCMAGIAGRLSTIYPKFRDWVRANGPKLYVLMERFAKSMPAPLTTVIVSTNTEYVGECCRNIDMLYGASNKFVFVHRSVGISQELASEYDGHVVTLSDVALTEGIRAYKGSLSVASPSASDQPLVPGKSGERITLCREEYNFINEDLEVVHHNILHGKGDSQARRDFMCGQEISWIGLSRGYDVSRDATVRLSQTLQRELDRRSPSVVYLRYPSGAGGTTVAKRVAWEFHNKYPTAVLRRYEPRFTANRIEALYSPTLLPILIVVEASRLPSEDLRRMIGEVRARTFPAVFLVVERSDGRGVTAEGQQMLPFLSDDELSRFIDRYSEFAPANRPRIEAVRTSSHRQHKNPFYIGLEAFSEEFQGLDRYVSAALNGSTEVQKKMAAFLAMAHFYGQETLPSRFFAPLLGLPAGDVVEFDDYITKEMTNILLKVDQDDGFCSWRPAHHLISKEILEQVLAGNAADRRIWRQNLSDYAIDFVECSAQSEVTPSEESINVLRRLFIERNEENLLRQPMESGDFSQLIEAIPETGSSTSRLRVFSKLCDAYPSESHFWAHLSRYYSKHDGNSAEALESIDKALLLTPREDALLYHMKGTCLAYRLRSQISLYMGGHCPAARIDQMFQDLAEIGSYFSKVRALQPNSEYGYVSHIQAILMLVDLGFDQSDDSSKLAFLQRPDSHRYRDLLDLAEHLLDTVQRNAKEQDDARALSSYAVGCKSRIDEIFEDYGRALAGWRTLLSRPDIYAPPVRRQLYRIYKRQYGGEGFGGDQDVIEELRALMEDNIKTEPDNDINLRLWFDVARYSVSVSIESATEKVARWYTDTDSQQAVYYLYVLHALRGIGGSSEAVAAANRFLRESTIKARNMPNRTTPYEWVGPGTGCRRLVNLRSLGARDDKGHSWKGVHRLAIMEGKIVGLANSGRGEIELHNCAMQAFFVPAHGNDSKGYVPGRDLNKNVKFYLSFSYDGLRAYNVRDAD